VPDYKTPGVYIEEIPATGPIAGVSTSTAAFLGPALDGPIGVPTKINNWTQYKATFGDFSTAMTLFLPYAVRGFLDNGGSSAYVVRVGSGRRAFLEVDDRGTPAGKALRFEAKGFGAAGNAIQVEIKDAQVIAAATPATPGVLVRKSRAAVKSAAGAVITLATAADAAGFQSGDVVLIEKTQQRGRVLRVSGADLQLTSVPAGAVDATTSIRIADLEVGQQTFRVQKPAGIEAGTTLTLTQGATKESRLVDAVAGETITLAAPGLTKAFNLGKDDPDVGVTTEEFSVIVSTTSPAAHEEFGPLSMDPRHSRYFARAISSGLIAVTRPAVPSTSLIPQNRPAEAKKTLADGREDEPGSVSAGDYDVALDALRKVDDVSLVCAPGLSDPGIQAKLIDHCERTGDRFAILDSVRGVATHGAGGVLEQRKKLTSSGGFAALYYPWIEVLDPTSRRNETLLVPPSGHVAGIFARSDSHRGVQKAPANEIIAGAVGLEATLDDHEQEDLNQEGVNALRSFAGQRPVVWGARTTAPLEKTEFRYVNVRRLLLFIEESIQEGIRWAVFEPNDLSLWKKLDRTIGEFLTRVWRSGALFGKTATDAFYIKIDEELNPPATRALGQVIIEVGVAPVRPAEFVVVRIAMWDGGAQTNEK
jgi:phage tail sheath protein FI